MPVTLADVRAVLDPEEPDYARAAALGVEALPHLSALVQQGDAMLASKAAYAAGLIRDGRAVAVLELAARSDAPTVRIAAAAATRHLPGLSASRVLLQLVGDDDLGVRKVALKSVPTDATADLRSRVESVARTEPEPALRELSARISRGGSPS